MTGALTFSSGKEFYEAINSCDLYNEETCTYVFLYNDKGAVCTYYILPDEALELQRKAEEQDEYWGAFLGWGGNIYDDPMDFCSENYEGRWSVCKDWGRDNK